MAKRLSFDIPSGEKNSLKYKTFDIPTHLDILKNEYLKYYFYFKFNHPKKVGILNKKDLNKSKTTENYWNNFVKDMVTYMDPLAKGSQKCSIYSYASFEGSNQYNLDLSERRGWSIEYWLREYFPDVNLSCSLKSLGEEEAKQPQPDGFIPPEELRQDDRLVILWIPININLACTLMTGAEKIKFRIDIISHLYKEEPLKTFKATNKITQGYNFYPLYKSDHLIKLMKIGKTDLKNSWKDYGFSETQFNERDKDLDDYLNFFQEAHRIRKEYIKNIP